MRRHTDDAVPVVVPPKADWKLISRKRFRSGDKIYNPGALVPIEALGRNHRLMLNTHTVEWVPPQVTTCAPIDAPPTVPEPKRPEVLIIDGPDAITAWRKTSASMTARCHGNAALANDLLLASKEGSELYRRMVTQQQRQRELR